MSIDRRSVELLALGAARWARDVLTAQLEVRQLLVDEALLAPDAADQCDVARTAYRLVQEIAALNEGDLRHALAVLRSGTSIEPQRAATLLTTLKAMVERLEAFERSLAGLREQCGEPGPPPRLPLRLLQGGRGEEA